jgi:hypothetical protein
MLLYQAPIPNLDIIIIITTENVQYDLARRQPLEILCELTQTASDEKLKGSLSYHQTNQRFPKSVVSILTALFVMNRVCRFISLHVDARQVPEGIRGSFK